MKQAYIEAFKEMMRVVLIAIIPLIIDQLNTGEINIRILFVVGTIAALRFTDKLLHTYGKEVNSPRLQKGLTQF